MSNNDCKGDQEHAVRHYLFVAEVREELYFTDVLLAVTSVFERDAVVYDALTSAQHLAATMPLFGSFVGALGARKYCKVVTSVTTRSDAVQAFLHALSSSGTDFRARGIGSVMLIPLDAYVGPIHEV